MVMFWPINQELDCISHDGVILGKIRFNANKNQHVFYPTDTSIELNNEQQNQIAHRLFALDSGDVSIPMPDDD